MALLVLDASALLNNPFFSFSPRHRYLATPEVYREWRALEPRLLAEHARVRGWLALRAPSTESVARVRQATARAGFTRLSRADQSVLALALDLQREGKAFCVVTDDYAIQNFLALFGVAFEPVNEEPIREVIAFEAVCPACGRRYHAGTRACPVCGCTLSVRRVKKARHGRAP